MGRYLIVANQTLGGHALDRHIQDLLSRDRSVFYVVVPTTKVEHEATGWAGGFALAATAATTTMDERALEGRRHEAGSEEARRRAQQRLDQMLDKLQSAGSDAQGEVGIDDPLESTRSVLARQAAFDGIIVSTLPAGMSRWLKMDVPSRISRMVDVPVTAIEAEQA